MKCVFPSRHCHFFIKKKGHPMSDLKQDQPPLEADTQPPDYLMSGQPETPLNLNESSQSISQPGHDFPDSSNPSRLAADHLNPGLEGESSKDDQSLPHVGEKTARQDDFASAATLGPGKVSFDGMHTLFLREYRKRVHWLRNMIYLDYLSLSEITFEWCESYDSKDWQR